MNRFMLLVLVLVWRTGHVGAQSNDVPHIEKRDDHFSLIVDGKPFFILGGQINNSSAWPATLPSAWTAAENMHANTVEARVYWEQMEPTKGIQARLHSITAVRPGSHLPPTSMTKAGE